MKIVFVSNFLNHHTICLCESFLRICDSFYFIATDSNGSQVYQQHVEEKYVYHYDSNEERKTCEDLIVDSDVCIFGSSPNSLVKLRMKHNKLSFVYTERFFKKGWWQRFNLCNLFHIHNRILKYKKKNLFVLCASAYASKDLQSLGFPIEKCYKWGYFPKNIIYESIPDLLKKKDRNSFLWCGRFLKWKHPECAIELAKELRNNGVDFHMNLIGDGPLFQEVVKDVEKNNLSNSISFLNSKKYTEVREIMEKTEFFLFFSDYNEGWGAVLNEAMNSGCCVFANRASGSTPYLVTNGINGYIFENGNLNAVYSKLSIVLKNDAIRKSISTNAIRTIQCVWNSSVAAMRFVELSNHLLKYNIPFKKYDSGPCSIANVLSSLMEEFNE